MHACPCGHGQLISPAALMSAEQHRTGALGVDAGWSPWELQGLSQYQRPFLAQWDQADTRATVPIIRGSLS